MHSSGRSPIRTDEIVSAPVAVSRAGLRPDLNFARSVFVYRSLFDELASPQRLGLSEEDLLTAWPADEAVTATYRMGDHQVDLPLLVPVDRLHWYNAEFFRDVYGPDRPVQYYTHVPVERDDVSGGESAIGAIAREVERGTVIITDGYARDGGESEFDGWASHLSLAGIPDVEVQTLRGANAEGVLNQFVGIADFDGGRHFAVGPSCHEQFLRARRQGLLAESVDNGVEVVESITGAEAEQLWAIYEGPFDALSGGHALRAGFDRRAFMEAMGDPDVVKMVRRAAGDVTTLCLFVADLKQCPWLSPTFYEEHYGDAFRTDNVFVFTGMVSDETRRGSAYASTLIHTLAEILRLRGTSCVITFECNSVSSQYIPRIVTDSTNETGIAVMSGLEAPASSLAFKAIFRAT